MKKLLDKPVVNKICKIASRVAEVGFLGGVAVLAVIYPVAVLVIAMITLCAMIFVLIRATT